MAASPALLVDILLGVVAAAVLLGALAVAWRSGDRGVVLDAAMLGTGVAVTAWAVSAGLWPSRAVDVAALCRTVAAVASLGLALPTVSALRSRWRRVAAAAALLAHAAAQAGALGGESVRWPVPVAARAVTAARTTSAAPLLLIGLQAADISVSPRPLVLGWVVMVLLAAVRSVDLSTRLARERAEHDAVQRFQGAFEQALVGMALIETEGEHRGRLSEVNDAMCRTYRMERADLVGQPIEMLIGARPEARASGGAGSGPERRQRDRPMAGVLDRLREQRRVALPAEVPLVTADSRDAWGVVSLSLTDGIGSAQAVLQIEDVTERRVAREALSHLSMQDPLTGLANRRHLDDRLATALARAERTATPVALLLLDLVRFAAVNERHGAQVGDELLVEVGARLRAVTRPADVVTRLDADHFAVLLEELNSVADVPTVAERIISALAKPYQARDSQISVIAALGVAVATSAPRELLADAQLALDRAKLTRSARPVFFDEELRTRAVDRASIADELRAALLGTGLRVVYQPVVAIPGIGSAVRPVIGWEALLRWDRRGSAGASREQSPGAFLDIAEESGLIVAIGQRVLEIALAALAVLPAPAGTTSATMGVNFSYPQLVRPDAAARVIRAVETARLDPDQLQIEVTESVLVDGGDDVLATLRRLREHGVRIALDDFGTGHSSLSLLRRLPIDAVKIDTSLIAALERSRSDVQVVAGLVQLASGLGLAVVAEGVETADTDQVVQRLGVNAAQGWRYGKPMPAPWPHAEPLFAPLGSQRRPMPAASPGVAAP